MESIEQMIKRLCPKGVEYVKLGDLFELRNGYTPSKGNVDFWTDGTIPWFRMEDIRANGRILNDSIQHITPSAIKGKGLFPAGSFILATTATIGEHALLTTDSLANQRFTNLSVRKTHQKDVNVKFLYHYMFIIDEWCKNNVNSSSFASVDMNKLKEYMIPIPPLEIQSRIVEVLDKMTTLTAELEAELEARKQQYEYYRNKLLTFSEIGGGIRQVTWKTLGETCTILTGGEPCGNIIKGGKSDSMHPYAIFGNGAEIYGWSDTYRVGTDAVTISSIGANTGTIYYRKGPFTPIIRLKVILPGENLSQRFLYHILKTIKIKKKKSSVPNMNANEIKSILIPVPSMEEQERIVSILDRFETLTTDLQSGLPAEIEARRQQYEYYRNKLLTFDAV